MIYHFYHLKFKKGKIVVKFMVVDDSKIARRILCELVVELGHSVVLEAVSGEECIEKYDPSRVDCIFIDVEMDGISGIEATKNLTSKYKDINIIIVSSVSEANRLKEIELSGAKAMVKKPIDVEYLKEAIKKVL